MPTYIPASGSRLTFVQIYKGEEARRALRFLFCKFSLLTNAATNCRYASLTLH